ncbi:hypothetical protein AtDm6_3145 [Acetobacter tropicalis]|uniref:Uncharacterized protein n=1 Tax=Acetobacter tropicalis TaxID=104102 RepID=A0A094YGJ6_9PROT|nr:hypothetical protein AtDm6_3145 [Acetobacter tropicalis]
MNGTQMTGMLSRLGALTPYCKRKNLFLGRFWTRVVVVETLLTG